LLRRRFWDRGKNRFKLRREDWLIRIGSDVSDLRISVCTSLAENRIRAASTFEETLPILISDAMDILKDAEGSEADVLLHF